MTGKHGDDGRVRLCDLPDGTCAGLAVRRLSLERVRELAEEIWTASSEELPPSRPAPDPLSSRAGALPPGPRSRAAVNRSAVPGDSAGRGGRAR